MNLFEAKRILKANNFYLIKEEEEIDDVEPIVADSGDTEEHIITLYLKHTTGDSADMTTKAGRRKYYMRFGRTRHESYDADSDSVINEVVSSEYGDMGSSRYKGVHNSAEKVTKSWTWLDVNALTERLEEIGITVIDEEHTKARVENDHGDEPVYAPGQHGAYGENSGSMEWWSVTTSRYWYIKCSGPAEAFEDTDAIKGIFAECVPAYNGDYDNFDVTIK